MSVKNIERFKQQVSLIDEIKIVNLVVEDGVTEYLVYQLDHYDAEITITFFKADLKRRRLPSKEQLYITRPDEIIHDLVNQYNIDLFDDRLIILTTTLLLFIFSSPTNTWRNSKAGLSLYWDLPEEYRLFFEINPT